MFPMATVHKRSVYNQKYLHTGQEHDLKPKYSSAFKGLQELKYHHKIFHLLCTDG